VIFVACRIGFEHSLASLALGDHGVEGLVLFGLGRGFARFVDEIERAEGMAVVHFESGADGDQTLAVEIGILGVALTGYVFAVADVALDLVED